MADVSRRPSDRVSFLVTDDELWIANTGRALTEDDVHGLCGLGASSKVDTTGNRRASIGHKGLGFKSVLEITDEPAVYSRTHVVHARGPLRPPRRGRAVGGARTPAAPSVPAMRFPFAVPDVGRALVRLRRRRASTPRSASPSGTRSTPSSRAAVADLLLRLPLTTVLFLKHLETVEVRVEQDDRREARTWTRPARAPRRDRIGVGAVDRLRRIGRLPRVRGQSTTSSRDVPRRARRRRRDRRPTGWVCRARPGRASS